jgi:hypothetical protein
MHETHVALEMESVAEAAEAHRTSGCALVHVEVPEASVVRIERALAYRANEFAVDVQHFGLWYRHGRLVHQHHLPCNVNTKPLLKFSPEVNQSTTF